MAHDSQQLLLHFDRRKEFATIGMSMIQAETVWSNKWTPTVGEEVVEDVEHRGSGSWSLRQPQTHTHKIRLTVANMDPEVASNRRLIRQ